MTFAEAVGHLALCALRHQAYLPAHLEHDVVGALLPQHRVLDHQTFQLQVEASLQALHDDLCPDRPENTPH